MTETLSRKGQDAEILHLEILRELTLEDLDKALAPVGVPPIKTIRQTHHLAARLMAEGRPQAEVSAITGYTQPRLSSFKQDPAFRELLEYYGAQVREAFAGVHERLAAFGFSCLEEAQRRLEESPDDFSLRELRQWMEATFDRSIAPNKVAAQAPPQSTGVVINVQFHSPEPDQGIVIEQKHD
jgi:hypothetical protein